MKIILSRKGLDSGTGGAASPIFPDRRMVSLPIPARRAPTRYSDVRFGDQTFGEIAAMLTGRPAFQNAQCHLDPDLVPGAIPRPSGWRGAFGQVNAAQSHLANNGVGPGDLFLFFGWFREVENIAERGHPPFWRFRRGGPDIHSLFGWLQIDEVLPIEDPDETLRARPWLCQHPHLHYHFHDNNCVYTGRERLIIAGQDTGLPGHGAFTHFDELLQLTEPGQSRSRWMLPGWFLPEAGPTLTYHCDAARWERAGDRCRLASVAKGQEFVMDISAIPAAFDWLGALFSLVEQSSTRALPEPAMA